MYSTPTSTSRPPILNLKLSGLQGIVASMTRIPTFRRRFRNLVKVLYVEAIESVALACQDGGNSKSKTRSKKSAWGSQTSSKKSALGSPDSRSTKAEISIDIDGSVGKSGDATGSRIEDNSDNV
ncbi:hypothetical protein IFM89_010029 [Coptis chinensis]|uniref:Uncharacterized protein n=1 Tax=Coptis chinensis TaxID=261450 RepID=A0A835HM42_9MAGN|nr:hypothetical protein IFM89_010029 [Coptis chinensis]